MCTTPFTAMARTILKSLGDGGAVRIIEIDHPLGGLHPEEIDARARAGQDQLDELLGVSGSGGSS